MPMTTLHEIAVEKAKKQPGMVDSLTEKAPILDRVKWTAATHNLWNVAEVLTDIKGAGYSKIDGVLPIMSASSDLQRVDLLEMGGIMECPTNKANEFGGPDKYFAKMQPFLLADAGMRVERQIIVENWLKAAISVQNTINAGGTGAGWFLLAVRFDENHNVGLYNPNQFVQGRFFNITPINGGKEDYLHSPGYEGVLGYAVAYRCIFGYQILDAKRTCAAIVNIDEKHHPTDIQINELLAMVRYDQKNTILVISPFGKIHAFDSLKGQYLQMANGDTDAKIFLMTWAGIPILTSHNISDKIDHI